MHRFLPSLGLLALVAVGCKSGEQTADSPDLGASSPAAEVGPSTATLSAGASAPGFELPNHDGTTVGLATLTARGPAVLVFYRGDW